jgi:hypothetical protein
MNSIQEEVLKYLIKRQSMLHFKKMKMIQRLEKGSQRLCQSLLIQTSIKSTNTSTNLDLSSISERMKDTVLLNEINTAKGGWLGECPLTAASQLSSKLHFI